MLSAAERAKFRAAQEQVLDLLGVPAVWHKTKTPTATSNITVGFKSVSWQDTELVNAWGVGAKIFTIKVNDVALLEKFDRIDVAGEFYTLDSVMPVYINGEQVFWKAYVKGD